MSKLQQNNMNKAAKIKNKKPQSTNKVKIITATKIIIIKHKIRTTGKITRPQQNLSQNHTGKQELQQ